MKILLAEIYLQFFLFNMVACGVDLSFSFAWINDDETRQLFISESQNNSSS